MNVVNKVLVSFFTEVCITLVRCSDIFELIIMFVFIH